jgi:hypothetical protein
MRILSTLLQRPFKHCVVGIYQLLYWHYYCLLLLENPNHLLRWRRETRWLLIMQFCINVCYNYALLLLFWQQLSETFIVFLILDFRFQSTMLLRASGWCTARTRLYSRWGPWISSSDPVLLSSFSSPGSHSANIREDVGLLDRCDTCKTEISWQSSTCLYSFHCMKASNDDFCVSKATTRDPGYSKKII